MTRSSYKILPFISINSTGIVNRNSFVTPSHVGNVYQVHSGKSYFKILVTDTMVSYKFGDFVYTKKRCVYRSKKRKKKK